MLSEVLLKKRGHKQQIKDTHLKRTPWRQEQLHAGMETYDGMVAALQGNKKSSTTHICNMTRPQLIGNQCTAEGPYRQRRRTAGNADSSHPATASGGRAHAATSGDKRLWGNLKLSLIFLLPAHMHTHTPPHLAAHPSAVAPQRRDDACVMYSMADTQGRSCINAAPHGFSTCHCAADAPVRVEGLRTRWKKRRQIRQDAGGGPR